MNAPVQSYEAGTQGPVRSYGRLTRTDIVRYAGASGDFNPIHHDEDFASSSGFPTVFAMGMLPAGILAAYATDWLGTAVVRRFSIRFREQVWAGDELTCSGTVAAVTVGDDGGHDAEVELICANQHGKPVVTASGVFRLGS